MSDMFTYEYTERKVRYETYEWDNTWIEHANDKNAKRVLYIGDSISCATRRVATKLTGEELLFDGFGTSKGIDNPFFKDAIKLYAMQEPGRNAMIFNNGLHGWHLSMAEYVSYYEELICFLKQQFTGTPLFLVLTTAVAKAESNARVVAMNDEVLKLAKKYDLPVIDLFSVSQNREGLICEDGIHLIPEGYTLLAKQILKTLKEHNIAI